MPVSANYLKAMSAGRSVVRRKPHVTGEVIITFTPRWDHEDKVWLASVVLSGPSPFDLLKRTDLTLDDIKRSNLHTLVAANLIEFVA